MANSKNRRKNGRIVRHDSVKRMRTQAAYDLKDLIICNCIDRENDTLVPRTVIFDRKQQRTTAISRLQEVAIRTNLWRWNIHSGIICRKPDGEVYLDKEENIFTQIEVRLEELNEHIAESLTLRFKKANPLNALTMFWIAAPYDMDDVPLRAILAPVFRFNVLGNMLTKYEQDTPELQVTHFRAETLADFEDWFLNQHHNRELLKQPRMLEICFVKPACR